MNISKALFAIFAAFLGKPADATTEVELHEAATEQLEGLTLEGLKTQARTEAENAVQQELTDLKNQVATLTQANADADQKIEAAATEAEQTKGEIETLRAEIKTLTQAVTKLSADLAQNKVEAKGSAAGQATTDEPPAFKTENRNTAKVITAPGLAKFFE